MKQLHEKRQILKIWKNIVQSTYWIPFQLACLLMSSCSFLLERPTNFLHSSDIGALAALAAIKNVIYTSSFEKYTSNHAFRSSLVNGTTALPKEHRHFRGWLHPFESIRALYSFRTSPSCCSFDYMGPPGDEKLVCTNAKRFATAPCWVMSIGSRANFKFEEVVARKTQCSIHIFDCTGDWNVPYRLRRRVTFHKLCLGHYGDLRENFRTFRQLVNVVSEQIGFGELPTMAKIDAEGYEYGALSELVNRDRDYMPDQLAVELHMIHPREELFPFKRVNGSNNRIVNGLTKSTALEFMSNMSMAGYELVNRVDNIACAVICTEVSWVKRDKLPEAQFFSSTEY